jgi:serine/threonine-protein kinase
MALLRDGQVIRETYEVERYLGEGAFAEVYRVKHAFLGRQAMKVFKTRGMTLQEIEDMLSEAVLLSCIAHPNIIRVFDANILESSGATFGYFTMEYVPGGTLDRYWRSYENKLMPVEEAVYILRQVCSGLAVAHGEKPPVIHRDIKPQNILIGYDSGGMRVRVSDFGLAKRVNPMTLLASAKGTLGFKPPESLENLDSCAADVWALGTTLYLLLTDKLPFPGLDERSISNATRFMQALQPASFYNIQVDPTLDSIVSRCLAQKPNDRYPNAKGILQDLGTWKPAQLGRTPAPDGTRHNSSKTVLGKHSPVDKRAEAQAVKKAIKLSREPGKLPLAADLLEEAMSKDPDLRQQYGSQLKLWRRGISM